MIMTNPLKTRWDELLKCETNDDSLQMCQKCGTHCSAWDWETSGYALLNGTELEVRYITSKVGNSFFGTRRK